MKTLLAILCLTLPDLSKVTQDDIIKTVEHMQRLNHELQDKLATVEKENAAIKMADAELRIDLKIANDATQEAKSELPKLQTTIDNLAAAVQKAEAETKRETAAKWFWIKISLALGVIDLGLLAWIFRKPLLALFV